MKYRRTLLITLAILGPMAVALSSCGTESTYAYNQCSGYYDPNCAYPYNYAYGDFFFGDDRRFDHRFDHDHDHDFGHDHDHDFDPSFGHAFDPRFGQGVDHGGVNHGGLGGVRSGAGVFIPGGGGRGR